MSGDTALSGDFDALRSYAGSTGDTLGIVAAAGGVSGAINMLRLQSSEGALALSNALKPAWRNIEELARHRTELSGALRKHANIAGGIQSEAQFLRISLDAVVGLLRKVSGLLREVDPNDETMVGEVQRLMGQMDEYLLEESRIAQRLRELDAQRAQLNAETVSAIEYRSKAVETLSRRTEGSLQRLRRVPVIREALRQDTVELGKRFIAESGGKSPEQLSELYGALSWSVRQYLTQEYPNVLGKMDGIPPRVRHECNVVELDKAIDATPPGGRLRQLLDLRDALDDWNQDEWNANNQLTLIYFNNDTPHVQAAVAVGNLETAVAITVHVPGMRTTVGGDTITSKMKTLDGQRALTEKIMKEAGHEGEAAAVFWLGYDSPNFGEAIGDNSFLAGDVARKAAPDLVRFSQGLMATSATTPTLTLSAHSYGSEVGFYALADESHCFENVVFYGSPGYPQTPVNLNPNKLYFATNPTDYVSHSSGLIDSAYLFPNPLALVDLSPHGRSVFSLYNVDHLEVGDVTYGGKTYVSTWDKLHDYSLFDSGGEPILTSTDLNIAKIAAGMEPEVARAGKHHDDANAYSKVPGMNLPFDINRMRVNFVGDRP